MSDLENQIINDQCMTEVLSFLTVPELSIAATVSKQYQRISQYLTRDNHSHNKVEIRNEYREITLDQFQILLENFGNYLEKLAINVDIFPSYNSEREIKIFEQLATHFIKDNHKLKELSLQCFKKLELIELIGLLPVFQHLNTLKLQNMSIPITIPELLFHLKHLKYLMITFCKPIGPLYLTDSEPRIFTTTIEKLDIRANRHLMAVYLLRNMNIYFPNLKELSFRIVLQEEHFSRKATFDKDILQIAELPNLTKLILDLEFRALSPLLKKFIQKNIKIKYLDISFASIDENTLQLFSQMQSIETLRLYAISNINQKFILGIGNCLLNLIKIETNVTININTLLKLVQSSPKTEMISIKMHSAHRFNSQNYKQLLNICKLRETQKKLIINIVNTDRKTVTRKEKCVLNQGKECLFLRIQRHPGIYPYDEI